MDILELIRKETSSSETIGILMVNKKMSGVILEPPMLQNKRGLSCIPTGQYLCNKYFSEKYQCVCLSIHDVPGRDYIAIHAGNSGADTKGCLVIGIYTGYLKGSRAVLGSKKALKSLMDTVGEICHLTIKENF